MYSGDIKTVNGLISSLALGHCQCHEHIYIKDETDDFNLSLKELKMYKEAGGNSLVDAQPQSAGSDLKVLRQLSIDSGVNIVASTGFHKTTYYKEDSDIYTKDVKGLANVFIDEIQQGAGIIKTALVGEITGIYKKLHESAAITAKETGSSIMCHIDKDTGLMPLISFYMGKGINPSKLILCHADRFVSDMNEHVKAAYEGAFLEYDTIARHKYHTDIEEIEKIKFMIGYGLVDNLLLSLDTTRERLFGYSGNVGLFYILKTFIPMLKENGINDSDIKRITVDNCAKALSFI